MRLVHRIDPDGRLRPSPEPGVAGRSDAARHREGIAVREAARYPQRVDPLDPDPELEGWIDPEYHQHIAEDWGLAPQRSYPPLALVVEGDPDVRIMLRRALEADGYVVVTCPGPQATRCEASRAGAACVQRCPRVRADTEVIVLDAAAEATRVAEAYAVWAPGAEIRHAP